MTKYVFSEGYKPRVPNRVYEAQCIRYDNKFVLGKTKKLFLKFKILDMGEHHGKEIFMAFNMRYDDKIKQGSKYFKTWCLANNWSKPSRNAKMSPRIFINKIFKIKTRTVKPPYYGKESMPEDFWYSIVDTIVEVVA